MGGMLGYLVVNQWGVNAWLGCVFVVVVACAFTATPRTASSGSRCAGAVWGWPR